MLFLWARLAKSDPSKAFCNILHAANRVEFCMVTSGSASTRKRIHSLNNGLVLERLSIPRQISAMTTCLDGLFFAGSYVWSKNPSCQTSTSIVMLGENKGDRLSKIPCYSPIGSCSDHDLGHSQGTRNTHLKLPSVCKQTKKGQNRKGRGKSTGQKHRVGSKGQSNSQEQRRTKNQSIIFWWNKKMLICWPKQVP